MGRLCDRDGEKGNRLTGGGQDKPKDPSLFSHGYRISNGGQETPPYQPAILLKMTNIFGREKTDG